MRVAIKGLCLQMDHIFKPYKNQVTLCLFSFKVELMIMIIGEQENYVYIGADGIYSTSEVMVSSNTFWPILM
jgi:hypothetical protein